MTLKRYILSVVCIFFALAISAKQFTVVLDPGHGGKDPGAVGKVGQEKAINLNVALAVGELITEKYPDVKVVYTRKTDKYVTLQDRPNIANEADGDLFISIHTNASESSKAYGAETFTLGLSKSQANFEVAKRENSVLLLEEGNKETYQGFDPTSPESYIMFEFMQSKYVDQSVEIAYYIQKEFVEIKRLDRGVRQAIFWVLHQVKMPSILVELGFITNPNEEKFLMSTEGQNKMANCIFSAFEKYKHEYDKRTITTPQMSQKEEKVEVKEKPQVKQDKKPENQDKDKDKDKKDKKKKDKEITNKDKNNNPKQEVKSDTTSSPVVYKIQVFSSRSPIKKDNSDYKKTANFKPVSFFTENGWYKYTCGDSHTYAEAQQKLEEISKLFKDALIVAFEGEKKIPLNEAKEKEGKKEVVVEKEVSKIIFKIQVFSSRNVVEKNHYDIRRIQKYGPVTYYTENGWHKYTCGETTSYDKIKETLKEVQKMFKDAVIVAFEGDKKIPLKEALNKLSIEN